MTDFEQSLARVLDPDHYLWGMVRAEPSDDGRKRLVEIRLDVPEPLVDLADRSMQVAGWRLSSRPDKNTDAFERVFWRKDTAVRPKDITSLLTGALRVAHKHEGTLMSWVNVEDLEAD